MATKQASSLNKRVYQGEDGNLSKEGFVYTFAADAVGTEIQGLRLPAGLRITGVEYVNAALGASVTFDVKVGSTTLVAGISASAANSGYKPIEHVDTTVDNTILSVVVGGAAATGKLTVRIHYTAIGTL